MKGFISSLLQVCLRLYLPARPLVARRGKQRGCEECGRGNGSEEASEETCPCARGHLARKKASSERRAGNFSQWHFAWKDRHPILTSASHPCRSSRPSFGVYELGRKTSPSIQIIMEKVEERTS
jgi:hypothetical protein